jgi:hypothetical protein
MPLARLAGSQQAMMPASASPICHLDPKSGAVR